MGQLSFTLVQDTAITVEGVAVTGLVGQLDLSVIVVNVAEVMIHVLTDARQVRVHPDRRATWLRPDDRMRTIYADRRDVQIAPDARAINE